MKSFNVAGLKVSKNVGITMSNKTNNITITMPTLIGTIGPTQLSPRRDCIKWLVEMNPDTAPSSHSSSKVEDNLSKMQ